ncbi:MAG: 16S rRNA (cytidine(1402)-2'-O)-methyltransferase [Candidatus Omnitrophica bacterium]|nr:16S rRNA (cytidine(1402)-2'-O)-methyltransferase [Candidatus Omnitrophota bacterium]
MAALYLVATPIGNLSDMSPRAVETLKSVGLIAAEDTRHTGLLLHRFGIQTPMTPFYDAVEREKTPGLIERLKRGESVALVSDAGTPLVSDPGYRLVGAARQAGIPVVAIPGPAAFLSALVSSGFPMDRFLFEGFLPKKRSALARRAGHWKADPKTIVVYESPYRLVAQMKRLQELLGDVEAMVARELTKLHEETRLGTLSELVVHYAAHPPKGEVTLIFRPTEKKS